MLCRRFLAKNETDLCHQCFSDAPIYPFGSLNPDKSGKINTQFLDSFTAVWYYEEDVRRSILRYKFRRGVFLAPKFGRMVAMKLLQQEMEQADVLTWVPVSAIRRFRRGYDQCQLLARQVGGELGLPAVSPAADSGKQMARDPLRARRHAARSRQAEGSAGQGLDSRAARFR